MRRTIPLFALVGLVVVCLFPLAWLGLSSFKHRIDLLAMPPKLIFEPTLSNYRLAFARGFGAAAANSLVVAALSSLVSAFVAYPAALALRRMGVVVRGHLLFFVLSTRLVPAVALGLPLHIMFRDLSLLDTRVGLALAHTAFNVSFAVWMAYAYIRLVPESVRDAAELDGLGLVAEGRALWPSMRWSILMVFVFCFVFSWNEFFLSSILAIDHAKTLPVSILGLVTSQGTYWGQFAAVGTMTIVPTLVLALVVGRAIGAAYTLGAAGLDDRGN